jgi:hypothetical protein
MSSYPEHDKLERICDKSQSIGEFLEWVGDTHRLTLTRVDIDGRQWPPDCSTTQLLAEFYEIDLDKLEREKREMLDALR